MMLLAITLSAALVILLKGLFSLNRMSHRTRHGARIAWLLMTAGAFGILVDPVYGRWHAPTLQEVLLLVGVAVYVIFERRRTGDHGGRP